MFGRIFTFPKLRWVNRESEEVTQSELCGQIADRPLCTFCFSWPTVGASPRVAIHPAKAEFIRAGVSTPDRKPSAVLAAPYRQRTKIGLCVSIIRFLVK
jgi:hypothetical protein